MSARALVTVGAQDQYAHDSSLDIIWNLLDYGWLTDPARPSTLTEVPHMADAERHSSVAEPFNLADSVAISEGMGANNATSSSDDNSYTVVGHFDVNRPLGIQQDAPIDFMAFPEGVGDPWPELVDGEDIFFSHDLVNPAAWTPHIAR